MTLSPEGNQKNTDPFKQKWLWSLLNTHHTVWEFCTRVKTTIILKLPPFHCCPFLLLFFFKKTNTYLKIWAHINDHTPYFCCSLFLTSSKQFPTSYFALMQFPVWNSSGLSYRMFVSLPECMFWEDPSWTALKKILHRGDCIHSILP